MESQTLRTARGSASLSMQASCGGRPRRLRAWRAALLGGALSALLAFPARAATEVVIEIDTLAERFLDARATRRLVALELGDVQVPASPGGPEPALFFRMLGYGQGVIRVELWERGELHDARLVSTSQGSEHLVARRVGLAAAELARGLRQRRLASLRRQARERAEAEADALKRALSTREGPLALRAAIGVQQGKELTLLASSLALELSLRGPLRLDLGARWAGGEDSGVPAPISFLEMTLGPARRFRIGSHVDLDVAPHAALGVVNVAGASAVDAVPGVRQTWSARAAMAVRLQPRLSRSARASVGVEASLLLHDILAQFPDGRGERYRGFFFGVDLGVVLTPP